MTSISLQQTLEQAAASNPALANRIKAAATILARHAADRSARIITAHVTAAGPVYSVQGSKGARYDVTLTPQPSCTCPDHVVRGVVCKHLLACRGLELAMGAPVKAESKPRRVRAEWIEEDLR